jgi:hypothetical protein
MFATLCQNSKLFTLSTSKQLFSSLSRRTYASSANKNATIKLHSFLTKTYQPLHTNPHQSVITRSFSTHLTSKPTQTSQFYYNFNNNRLCKEINKKFTLFLTTRTLFSTKFGAKKFPTTTPHLPTKQSILCPSLRRYGTADRVNRETNTEIEKTPLRKRWWWPLAVYSAIGGFLYYFFDSMLYYIY